MIAVSLKNLLAHKRRLVSTCLAVFLGVAFLSGTLVLGDTLRSNFDTLFTDANAQTDAVLRSTTKISVDAGRAGNIEASGFLQGSLVGRVRRLPGVAMAEPSIQGYGRLLDRAGKAIGGNGPPQFAGNWIGDPRLNPYRLVEGRPPRAGDEVVINRGAAKAGHLRVGDRTTVETPEPVHVRIVGISTFGSTDGLGGVTFTAFTLSGAQRHVTKKPGEVSRILVRAAPGVSQQELVRKLSTVAPPGAEAATGQRLTQEDIADVNDQFLGLFRSFLLVFAGVALLVATFSIYNTFSILVAQRTRQSALLRALGAARGQVLGSIAIELAVVGVLASAAGLAGGLGFAGLLKGLFDTFGFALPAGGLVVGPASLAVAMITGVVVTVLAGIAPALRTSRVRPMAAVREAAQDRSGTSSVRTAAGAALLVAGALLGFTARGGGLARTGAGALLAVVGAVVSGPVVAQAASGTIGWPLSRLRGVAGALARRNAMRNPKRTSSTATALMIGVSVVTLFTVFAASLKASVSQRTEASFGGDLVINAGRFGGGGFSPRLASDVARLPEVARAAGLGSGAVLVGGTGQRITVSDPAAVDDVLDLGVREGSLAALARTEVAVSAEEAADHGWRRGSTVTFKFADGRTAPLTIGAIFTQRDVIGDYLIGRATWAPHAAQDIDSTVLIKLRTGTTLDSGKRAVERVAARNGSPEVLDRKGYADSATASVDTLLGIVYVMLALAILIALMGIANTLSLSIHERTREIALLRAVGETRAQVRSMVRWESVIVAVFGTAGGLGLGLFLGWSLVRAALSDTVGTFSVPVTQLGIVLVVGAAAGLLAGIRPARRAARLDVLTAIATE